MGSGKSTIGPLLADAVGADFVDLDQVITEAAGTSVSEIFAREGEEGWRRRERAALLKTDANRRIVLSCGGGVVLGRENRAFLKNYYVTVYLLTSPGTLERRLHGRTGRPLLDVDDERVLRRIYDERLPVYEKAAQITVATDEKTPESLVREILMRIEDESDDG